MKAGYKARKYKILRLKKKECSLNALRIEGNNIVLSSTQSLEEKPKN